MAPIRVGIIGLTAPLAKDQLSGKGAWGILAHLPSLQSLPDFEIVAVSNSSVESSLRSIRGHDLPASTKAYGNPDDLARDPDVDLVVVSVDVGKHFMLAKPALLQKKDVYVEWPLGASVAEAEQLAELAQTNGVKTIVGLQGRSDPLLVKLKELLEAGKIGQVIGSSLSACSSVLPSTWHQGAEYYLDMKSGGNEYYIFFGHVLDIFTQVLGDFSQLQSVLKTQLPTLPLASASGEIIDPAYPKTSPDHVAVQGILQNGAVASLNVRRGPAPVDGVGFRWLITGTAGEIEVSGPEAHWQFGPPGRKLMLKVGKSEAPVVEVAFDGGIDEHVAKVSFPGTNTAHSYDAFAKGDTARFATFESALKLQRLLEEIVVKSGFEVK